MIFICVGKVKSKKNNKDLSDNDNSVIGIDDDVDENDNE